MQEIWLDGNKIDVPDIPESGSIEALLDDVESKHLRTGRMIRSVRLDGEELRELGGDALEEIDLGAHSRVDVESVELEDYTRELIERAPRHLEQVSHALANAVSLYRQNLPSEGAQKLHTALVGFDMLIKLVASVSLVWSVEVEDLVQSKALERDSMQSLRDTLENVVSCQEQDDTDGLARLLDEELLPRLAPWQEFFHDLSHRLRGDASRGASDAERPSR